MKYVILTIGLFLFISCKNKNIVVSNPDVYYTCSMHPQVISEKPGKCPICHMDLIAVSKANKSRPGEIELSEEQVQLGNILVDTIGKTIFKDQIVLTGTISFNQNNINTVSSPIAGRIDKLYFKNIGDYVPKGVKLYELYSEELNNAKQEYLLLLEKRKALGNTLVDFDQLLHSAKSKLVLWGMNEGQIHSLEQTGRSTITTSFYSSNNGYITALDITEGSYVMQGGLVIHLANLENVWAEAQVFTSQLSQINSNAQVKVQIPELNNKEITGRIEFVSPEINPQTRINLIRVTLPNQSGQLKPGMPVYIFISGQHSASLSLPIDALIRTNNLAQVWLMTGKNKFKLQQVQVGSESNNSIEVTQGLKPGNVVVVSGAYLLNSEYLLRNGGNSMEDMKM